MQAKSPSEAPNRYYFGNCLLLGEIVGRGPYPFLQFVAVVAVWLVLISTTASLEGILHTDHSGIIGLEDDKLFLSLCVLVPALVGAALYLVKRLDEAVAIIPKIISEGTLAKGEAEIVEDIDQFRKFISVRTNVGRVAYYSVMVFISTIFFVTQILNPLFFQFTQLSWALAPKVYPATFVVACFWSLFWGVIVAGNICWIVVGTLAITFNKVIAYARAGNILISPLVSTRSDAISKVGGLSLANALFLTCGLVVLIPWVWQFSRGIPGIIYVGLYLAAVISIGIIPVWIVGRAIRKVQLEYLRVLGDSFNMYLNLLMSELRQSNEDLGRVHPRVVAYRVNQLAIESAYGRVEKMVTWPIPRKVASIFSLNVIGGMLTGILQSKQMQDVFKIPDILKFISNHLTLS